MCTVPKRGCRRVVTDDGATIRASRVAVLRVARHCSRSGCVPVGLGSTGETSVYEQRQEIRSAGGPAGRYRRDACGGASVAGSQPVRPGTNRTPAPAAAGWVRCWDCGGWRDHCRVRRSETDGCEPRACEGGVRVRTEGGAGVGPAARTRDSPTGPTLLLRRPRTGRREHHHHHRVGWLVVGEMMPAAAVGACRRQHHSGRDVR